MRAVLFRCLLGLGGLLHALATPAATPTPLGYRRWTTDHGLPQNCVQALHQSRDGLLWVGTRFGLARFDGVQFVTITPADASLGSGESITALAEGDDGTIWVGTLQGLFRFRAGLLERIPGVARERVWAVWPGSTNDFWLGLGRGLARFAEGRTEIIPLGNDDQPFPQVRALALLDPGGLLITTLYGALRFDRQTRTVVPWSLPLPLPAAEPGPEASVGAAPGEWSVAPLAPAESAAFASRIFLRGVDAGTRQPWGTRLQSDGAGAWWVLDNYRRLFRVESGGIARWPPRTGKPTDDVLCVLRDREDGVWLGTVAGGLLRLREPRFETIPAGLGDEAPVYPVVGDELGRVWSAGRTNLVRITDHGVERLPLAWPDGPRQIMALWPSGDGGWWMGRDRGGIWKWREGRLEDWSERAGIPRDARVRSLLGTRDGTLWIGTRDGLHASRAGFRRRFHLAEGLPSASVGALHEDRHGRLWAGTDDGGAAWWDGGRFIPCPAVPGRAGASVWGFHEDRSGSLWQLGTHGLLRFRNGVFSAVTSREGLADDVNNQMFEDDSGYFWLGCNRGIYRVPCDALHRAADGHGPAACEMFGVGDGLEVAETNGENHPAGWRDPKGVLWFPGPVGVVRLDPARISPRGEPPPVLLGEVRTESLRLRDPHGFDVAPTRVDGTPTVPPTQGRVLEVHYTAPSFRAPERVQFRHRLVGHETAWISAGTRRVAFYPNLRPGRYRFEVIAGNDHGVWATEPATFAFVLLPHWYETRTFQVLLVLALAGTVLGIHRLRLVFVRRRLALEGELRLAHERARIARDMHDDLGAGLSQIGFLAERASRAPLGDRLPWLDRIAEASRDAAQTVDEIVWAVNPRHDRLESLANYVCQFAREFLEPSGLRCRLDVPSFLPDVAIPSEVRHHLLMTLKESLGNAVRHAHGTEVVVRLRLAPPELVLVVEDDGRGWPANPSEAARPGGGNGLDNLRRRAEACGGACRLSRSELGGARVEITTRLGPA